MTPFVGGTQATSTASNAVYLYVTNNSTSTATTASVLCGTAGSGFIQQAPPEIRHIQPDWRDLKLPEDLDANIRLADGTLIEVSKNALRIHDQDAKVIYKANRVREFNRYLNASDLIEDFIRYCGMQGVRQGEVLGIPINLFIAWLVIEAAKADDEPMPQDLRLGSQLKVVAVPRCLACGRFISFEHRRRRVEFCAPPCFERHFYRTPQLEAA